MSGAGGAQAGGVAVTGRSVELQRALQDLKADIKPEAESEP
jgi:hypothetical protein